MNRTPSLTKVLIVGAGPAGLFAASELLRHGFRPRIIERRLAPHHETRGTVIQPAVLEVLDRGGVIAPFLAAGVHIKHTQVLGPGLREIALSDFANIGCKYEFQCSLPQWRSETILRERLASRGLEVEFGSEVISIEAERAGLRVTLDKGGETEIIETDYLLGAGGGHDVTRHSMQEHLDGETYAGRYIVADAKLGLPCPADCGRVIVGRRGFVLASCSARLRGWTRSACAGAASSRSSMVQRRVSTRPKPAFRTAAPSLCARTASSDSAPPVQTKRR